MSRQGWIADALRDAGLAVVEVDGWRDRGSSDFWPGGVVGHQTAGPAGGGDMPSLNTLIYGRPDLAGPLGNVGLGRSGTYYVVAAGRANHAGKGGWRGLTGNSSVLGIEAENDGYQHVADRAARRLLDRAPPSYSTPSTPTRPCGAVITNGGPRNPTPMTSTATNAASSSGSGSNHRRPAHPARPLGADMISRDAIELVEHAFLTYPANQRDPDGDSLNHWAGLIAHHEHANDPKGAVGIYAELMRALDAE